MTSASIWWCWGESLRFASVNSVKPREGRIDYAGLTARPGSVSASGELQLATGRGTLHVAAERLTIAQRPEQWLMLSGTGDLEAQGADGLQLNAKMQIDGGFWHLTRDPAPRLSDDVVVKGREAGTARHRLPLSLDVALGMGRGVYFRGRGLDTRLIGNVRVSKSAHGPLRASGTIAARDGTFDAYGQALSIDRGMVNFQGPLDNPGLNVVALRKNLPVEAGVSVTGTVLSPQVKLVSEPNVPDSEKLSWIVLGRASDQVGGGDSALLLSAANAILGGQSGGISRQLAQSLGFDEIGIGSGQFGTGDSRIPSRTVAGSPSSASNASVTQQIFTVGKQISANARLSFERSLGGAETIVKITYYLTRQLSLTGRAGADNAVDLSYGFAFK
jgi:translocation and assembly module TamB